MKDLRYLSYVLLLALSMTACGWDDDENGNGGGGSGIDQVVNVNKNAVTTEPAVARLEFPKLKGGNSVVIVHRTSGYTKYDADEVNYAVEWDTDRKSQRFACYQMHNGYTGNYTRTANSYPTDPNLSEGDYWATDYIYGSGYDHGHICPNADRKFSHDANYQTFYLTNMQPQYRKFNGYSTDSKDKGEGLWVRLEGMVRGWVPKSNNDTLYVCKGGTIDNESDIITRINGRLIVPKYFFTVCLLKTSSTFRAIAFFMEQKNEWGTNDNLADYVLTVDELEERLGIDFFCNLPDDIENEVEAKVALLSWGLKE